MCSDTCEQGNMPCWLLTLIEQTLIKHAPWFNESTTDKKRNSADYIILLKLLFLPFLSTFTHL